MQIISDVANKNQIERDVDNQARKLSSAEMARIKEDRELTGLDSYYS